MLNEIDRGADAAHRAPCGCGAAGRVQHALRGGAWPVDILPGVQVGPQFFRSCDVAWHRGESCVAGNLKEIPGLIQKSFRVYGPVHLIPLLLFRTKLLMKDPVRVVLRTSAAIARSTGFLTLYVTVVKLTICALRQARGKDAWWHCGVAAMLSGLPLMLESDKRVSELMLYCMPKGVEVVFQWLERRGWVSRLPFGDCIMFAAAMALALALNRSDFKGANAHLLDFLFGTDQGRYYTDAEPDAAAPTGMTASLPPAPHAEGRPQAGLVVGASSSAVAGEVLPSEWSGQSTGDFNGHVTVAPISEEEPLLEISGEPIAVPALGSNDSMGRAAALAAAVHEQAHDPVGTALAHSGVGGSQSGAGAASAGNGELSAGTEDVA